MVTMLLGGLWHGAGWTFVVWGGLHGLFLVANHAWRDLFVAVPGLSARLRRVPACAAFAVAWCATFAVVLTSWVFFRATTLKGAFAMLERDDGPRTGSGRSFTPAPVLRFADLPWSFTPDRLL